RSRILLLHHPQDLGPAEAIDDHALHLNLQLVAFHTTVSPRPGLDIRVPRRYIGAYYGPCAGVFRKSRKGKDEAAPLPGVQRCRMGTTTDGQRQNAPMAPG